MKPVHIFFIFPIVLITSYAAFRNPFSSRFVDNASQLGMTKSDFIATDGSLFWQNMFYDENNTYCEGLIYREEIEHGGNTFVQGEASALNSIFLYINNIWHKLLIEFISLFHLAK